MGNAYVYTYTLVVLAEMAACHHSFIFLLGTTKSTECQLHLWRLATDNDNRLAKIDVGVAKYGSTVVADDEPKLHSIYNTIKGQISYPKIAYYEI